MTALYSEIDPFAAAWLRELIKAGHIAPGDVAECSIEDLTPNDVRGYTQFHAYAGIGVWSYALRAAGWPDDRPVWTFSEPCQPFSAAGKRGGVADERYLRPATHHLVRVCRPAVCFGEQVASKDGLGWLDTLQADMEGEGYAFGAVDTCSAGHGVEWEESQAGEWLRRAIHDCPDPWIKAQLGDFADFARGNFSEGGHHIRQRLRFVAERLQQPESDGRHERRAEPGEWGAADGRGLGGLDDAAGARHVGPVEGAEGNTRDEARLRLSGAGRRTGRLGDDDDARLEGQRDGYQAPSGRVGAVRSASETSEPGGVAITDGRQLYGLAELRGLEFDGTNAGRSEGSGGAAARSDDGRVADAYQQQRHRSRNAGASRRGEFADGGATSGPDPRDRDRRRVDWLFCRDGKWRATRSGAFTLAHGASARVGRLRAYGNAVDAEATIQFIEAYLDAQSVRFVERVRLTEGVFS